MDAGKLSPCPCCQGSQTYGVATRLRAAQTGRRRVPGRAPVAGRQRASETVDNQAGTEGQQHPRYSQGQGGCLRMGPFALFFAKKASYAEAPPQ